MKKYLILIVSLITIIIVISVSLLVINKNNSENDKCYDSLNLEEIYDEINLSTNNLFELIDKPLITMYLPLDFSNVKDYIIAVRQDNKDEYFAIIKDLDNEQLKLLENLIDQKKKENPLLYEKSSLKNTNGFTYVTTSLEYSSIIEGIIRSFIYCE